MSSYVTGHAAEQRAARYLAGQGYVVRQLNWRTRFCEIDIVAEKNGCLYFVEVKYRRDNSWGAGYDYITPRKLARMNFAAEFWLAAHGWAASSRLAVVSVDGSTFRLDLL